MFLMLIARLVAGACALVVVGTIVYCEAVGEEQRF